MGNGRADGAMNLYTALVFVIADIIALTFRIVSKRKTKKGLQCDDWWICAGLVLFFAWCGLIIYEVAASGGTLQLTSMRNPKCLWISTFFFPLSFTATKISILCFYRSIFVVQPFRWATNVVMVLCVLWCVIILSLMAFKCPVNTAWDSRLALTAQCFPYGSFALGAELSNLVLDVAILAIPVCVVSSLQLGTQQKVLLASIFLLGGFVIITSICHAIYSYDLHATQFVKKFPKAILWTTIETGTAIICACLLTYRPLIPQRCTISAKLKSWYFSIRGTSQSHLHSEGSDINIRAPKSPSHDGSAIALSQSDDEERGGGREFIQTHSPFGSSPSIEGYNDFRAAASGDSGFFVFSKNAIMVETRIDVV